MPEFGEVLAFLAPIFITDWLLYMVFLFALISLFLIPEKQLTATLFMTATLGLTAFAKVAATEELDFIDREDFPFFIVNALILVIPLITAGIVRSDKSGKKKAIAPAAITGVFAAVYFLLFWLLFQRAG